MKTKKTLLLFRKFCLILPIIYVAIILIFSSYIFDKCEEQTYQRVKSLKEVQIQNLASQIDHVTAVTGEMSSEEVDMLSTAVSEMNKMDGVYCFLFNKDYEMLSSFNNRDENEQKIASDLIQELVNGNYTVQEHSSSFGWITTKSPVTGKDFEVYWQGIPTSVNKDDCEYFVILAVSRVKVENVEAMNTCKVFIAILTITLSLSLYDSVHIREKFVWKD